MISSETRHRSQCLIKLILSPACCLWSREAQVILRERLKHLHLTFVLVLIRRGSFALEFATEVLQGARVQIWAPLGN